MTSITKDPSKQLKSHHSDALTQESVSSDSTRHRCVSSMRQSITQLDYLGLQSMDLPKNDSLDYDNEEVGDETAKERATRSCRISPCPWSTHSLRLLSIPLLIVIVGALTSAAFMSVGILNALQDQQDSFTKGANNVIRRFTRYWEDYVNAASWIHGRCRDQRLNLTRTEFREMYEYLVASGLDFQAAQFDPNITREERPLEEEKARQFYAQYYPHVDYRGFVGFNHDNSTSLDPRLEHDFYFPIHYMEPIVGNERAIDLDYHASGTRRDSVLFCMETGKPALTERLRLVQEKEEVAYGVVLMHPGVNLTTQRDVWPRDLASIVIRVNDILLRSTEDRSYSFAVYIHDASDSSGTPLFMGGIEVQGKATGDDDGGDEESKPRFLPQVEIDELAMGDRLYLQGDVQAANRIWTVTVVALPGTFEPDVLVVAVGGSIIFIATLLVAVWVFINTRKIETANRRAERLLLNVLPEEMAERLKTNPSHVADHFDSATVLFADIVGFTQMSNSMPAIEVVGFLNDLFSRFDSLLDKYGLNKIKTIGDAYMVATVPHCDCPQVNCRDVCNFALDMAEAIKRRNQEHPDCQLELRIGINCGPVVAGVVGHKRFLYDLWGDTVNVASRFESSGVPGKIQITKNIMDALPPGEFCFEKRGKIKVKGIGEMEAFFLHRDQEHAIEQV